MSAIRGIVFAVAMSLPIWLVIAIVVWAVLR